MNTLTHLKQNLLGSVLAGLVVTSSVVIAPILSTHAYAEEAENLVAAKRLNDLLVNIKSMSANFTQTTKGATHSSKSLSGNGTFSGVMSVERPNKFRWETKVPTEQLIVANGNMLWVYDKDLEQATKQQVGNQVGNTPALLFSGSPEKIAQSFRITQPNHAKNYYVLYPTTKDSNFKSLAISFNQGKPVMMVLNDNLGQTTAINFNNIKLNPKFNSSQFKFSPPKGIDVIEQ